MTFRPSTKAALLLASALFTRVALAQTPTIYTSGTYSQNFNTLPYNSSGTNVVPSATPSINSTTYTLPSSGAFDLSNTVPGGSGLVGWYASDPSKDVYGANGGSTTTGGIYSFGAASASGTDRALGIVSTSTTGVGEVGLLLQNNGSTALNQFTLAYGAELWHQGTAAKTLSFGYLVSSSLIALPTTGLTSVSALGSGSFTTGSVQATDGTTPAATNNLNSTVSLGTAWTPGTYLWLTWTMNSSAGSGQGVGIDDLTFSALLAGRSITWNGGTGTWNTASNNWQLNGGATAYNDNNSDTVTFADGQQGTVTIQAGGVTPTAVNVTNTTGTYTLTGGPILGNGALTKSGAGTLILTASNGFSGGLAVNGGLVAFSDDDQLGASGVAASLGGGTLQTGTSVTFSRTLNVTATGGTLDTNGFDSIQSGTGTVLNITGAFTKAGIGMLTFTGSGAAISTSGAGSIAISSGSVNFNSQNGTASIAAVSSGGTINGDILLSASGQRINFNAGLFSGAGKVLVQSTSTSLANAGTSVSGTLGNSIVLNSSNAAGPFITNIGATSGNALTITGTISGVSDVNLAVGANGGAGILTLGASNSYAGTTFVNNSKTGVIRLNVDNALPSTTALSFGDGVNTGNTGAIDLNGHNLTIASLATASAGSGQTFNGIANTGVASTLTISGTAATTYAGTIGIPASTTNLTGANNNISVLLASKNTGSLILSGSNSYTGGTTVNGGTLIVQGSISGTTTVNSGGILGGSGTLDAISVANGGVLSPGNSGAGTLTANSLTLSANAKFKLELGGVNAGTDYDQLSIAAGSGAVNNAGAALDVHLILGYAPIGGTTFTILDNNSSNAINGTFAGLSNGATFTNADGQQFQINYNTGSGNNDIILTAMAVPEPATLAMVFLGALTLVHFQHLKKSRKP